MAAPILSDHELSFFHASGALSTWLLKDATYAKGWGSGGRSDGVGGGGGQRVLESSKRHRWVQKRD